MFSYKKPIELEVEGQKLKIHTSSDVEIALSGRTNPSPHEVIRLIKLSSSTLRSIKKQNDENKMALQEMLASGVEDDTYFLSKFRSVRPEIFTRDNAWQSIFLLLLENKSVPAQVLRISLLQYIEYLSKHNQIIHFLRSKSHRQDEMNGSTRNIKPNSARSVLSGGFYGGFMRLAKNTPFQVEFTNAETVDILLANQNFKLTTGKQWYFVSPDDHKYPLKLGRTTIGRSETNDIVLKGKYKDISRTHLIINRRDDHTAEIMDTSTLGTFIPAHLVQ